MAVIEVSSNDFEREVLKSEMPVLVDFWAPWCGPCKMLGPVVEQLAAEKPNVKFVKVNVDESTELAMVYRISAIPALLLFKDGKVVDGFQEAQPESAIRAMLAPHVVMPEPEIGRAS